MEGCLDDGAIAALAAGETAARGQLAHLEICDGCRELVSVIALRRTAAGDAAAAPVLAAGAVLGRHRIERPLGAGAMGVVYLATDLELNRPVAIKLLRARSDERAHARLAQESRALARLSHPNVVTAYEVGQRDGASYLIMEHVDGGTARDWLAAAVRTPEEIAALYAQAARGLAAAHAAGLVHRDVKPDNVLVGSDGRARVSDFGLARDDGDARTDLAGTLRYMAPEVLAGATADARSDQWSLAASVWEGLEPVASEDVPAWLRRALMQALAHDPAQRFASLDELAAALAPARSHARRTIAVAFGAAVLAAGVAALLLVRGAAPACRADLAGAWGAPERARLVAHLRTLGERSAQLAEPIALAVDDYAARWRTARTDACRAERTDPRGKVPAQRAGCLESKRGALAATVEALATASMREAERAPAAVADLPRLSDCIDADRLAGRQPLPPDGPVRAQILALEHHYDAARAAGVLGRHHIAAADLQAIAAAAEALGYAPLAAEALHVAGEVLQHIYDPAAIPTLRRALLLAQAGADDRDLTEIAFAFMNASVLMGRPLAERDELRAFLRAAHARLHWQRDAADVEFDVSIGTLFGRDDYARGNAAVAVAELREALAAGIALYGARSPELAITRSSFAKALAQIGAHDEAAQQLAAIVEIDATALDRGLGLTALGPDAAIPEAVIEAAVSLRDVGRDDQALAFVQRARAAGPPAPMFALALDDLEAQIALARGDVSGARTLVERAAASLGPNPVPSHATGLGITRGEIAEALGDRVAAETEYRAVLAKIDPRGAEQIALAKLGLARCLAGGGDVRAAIELTEAVLASGVTVGREIPRAQQQLAEWYWALGDRERALAAAHAARISLEQLPALVAQRAAVDAWLSRNH